MAFIYLLEGLLLEKPAPELFKSLGDREYEER